MLRHYAFQVYKDSSGTDDRQVPAGSASITVYKQGATADGGGTISGAPDTIAVHSPGQIVQGDTIFLGTDTSITAHVSAVSATQITVDSISATLTWTDGTRVRASTDKPTLYSDNNSGDSISNPLTTNATTGFAECWAEPTLLDAIISGSGITTKGLNDVSGGGLPSGLLRVEDFPGSDWGEQVAAAMAALTLTTGNIVDARGLTGLQSCSQDPFSGITEPFALLIGPTVVYTNSTFAVTGSNQHIVGMGAGLSEIRGASLGAGSRLLSIGDTTQRVRSTVRDLTLNASLGSGSVGLRFHGAGPGCMAQNVYVRQTLTYGIELAQNTAETENVRLQNVDIDTGGNIGIYLDSTAGYGNSVDGATLQCSTTSAVAAIDKNNAQPASFRNIWVSGGSTGYARGIRLAADGGCDIANVTGDTGVTALVYVENTVNNYTLRNIIGNGSTNVLDDQQKSVVMTEDLVEVERGYATHVIDTPATGDPDPVTQYVVPTGYTATEEILQVETDSTTTFAILKDGALAASNLEISAGAGPATVGLIHANWGTTASTGTVQGTDANGQVNVTAGGASISAYPELQIDFSTARTATYNVLVTGPNNNSASVQSGWIVVAFSASSFTVRYLGTPTSGFTYGLGWVCVDY